MTIESRLLEIENKVRYMQIPVTNQLIAVRYTTNTGQTISDTNFTVVNYEDKVYDALDLVTVGAAWSMFIPVTGLYRVSAMNRYASVTNWEVGEGTVMNLYKSGVLYTTLDRFDGGLANGNNISATLRGSDDVLAERGETLNIQLNNTSGGDRILNTTANHNRIAIHLVHTL